MGTIWGKIRKAKLHFVGFLWLDSLGRSYTRLLIAVNSNIIQVSAVLPTEKVQSAQKNLLLHIMEMTLKENIYKGEILRQSCILWNSYGQIPNL